MLPSDNTIPIFPLNLVVFPGESLNLHIFEKRYKTLINECLSTGKEFGIPAFIDGKIADYGTCVNIDQIDRVYTNGEMDIKTIGTKSFKIREILTPKDKNTYNKAKIEWHIPLKNGSEVLLKKIYDFSLTLYKYLQIDRGQLGDFQNFELYKIIHIVGLQLNDEFKFLKMKEELLRQEFLIRHLKGILPIVEETEKLKRKIQSNGHFKNIIPPKI